MNSECDENYESKECSHCSYRDENDTNFVDDYYSETENKEKRLCNDCQKIFFEGYEVMK